MPADLTSSFVLADYERGIGVVIFVVVMVVMWIIGAVAKSMQKPNQGQPVQRARRNQPVEPARQQRNQPRQKSKVNRPPPVPGVVIPVPRLQATVDPASPTMRHSARGEVQAELARNVRLMLTKSGAREAIVLNEILGKPKGLES